MEIFLILSLPMLWGHIASQGGWGEHYCKGTFGRGFCFGVCVQKLGCNGFSGNTQKIFVALCKHRKIMVPKLRPILYGNILTLRNDTRRTTASHLQGFGSSSRNPSIGTCESLRHRASDRALFVREWFPSLPLKYYTFSIQESQ